MTFVVHATSAHRPTDTRIFEKECRTLVEAGYQVALLAARGAPGIASGVRIEVVSAPGNRLARFLVTPWRLYRRVAQLRPDLVHLHDPELLPIGCLLAARGHTVVWDAHESLSLQLSARHWIPRPLRAPLGRLVGALERRSCRRFAAAVGATPEITAQLVAPRNVTVMNLPLAREFAREPTPYEQRPRHVVYVGHLTRARGVFEMLEAAESFPPDVRLVLAGPVTEPGLAAAIDGSPVRDRILAPGWVERDEVQSLLNSAAVGLAVLHPEPNYVHARPVKVFEYLAAGVPVVASDLPSWRPLIGDDGLLVDPLDPEAIAAAVTWLLDHPDEAARMGRAGRHRVLTTMTWDSQAETLLGLYDEVLASRHRVLASG